MIKNDLTPSIIFHLSNDIDEALGNKKIIDAIIKKNNEGIIVYNFLESIAKAKRVDVSFISPKYLDDIEDAMYSDTLIVAGLSDEEFNEIFEKTSNSISLFNISTTGSTIIKKNNKIDIHRIDSGNAKTAKKGITEDELLEDILLHKEDVQNVGHMLTSELNKQFANHDYTKILYLDKYLSDYIHAQEDESFDFKKDGEWYNIHVTKEDHHLDARVSEDVTLLKIIETVVDNLCAGLTRGGEVYPLEIPYEVYKLATKNLEKLIFENIRVIEKGSYIKQDEPKIIRKKYR